MKSAIILTILTVLAFGATMKKTVIGCEVQSAVYPANTAYRSGTFADLMYYLNYKGCVSMFEGEYVKYIETMSRYEHVRQRINGVTVDYYVPKGTVEK